MHATICLFSKQQLFRGNKVPSDQLVYVLSKGISQGRHTLEHSMYNVAFTIFHVTISLRLCIQLCYFQKIDFRNQIQIQTLNSQDDQQRKLHKTLTLKEKDLGKCLIQVSSITEVALRAQHSVKVVLIPAGESQLYVGLALNGLFALYTVTGNYYSHFMLGKCQQT